MAYFNIKTKINKILAVCIYIMCFFSHFLSLPRRYSSGLYTNIQIEMYANWMVASFSVSRLIELTTQDWGEGDKCEWSYFLLFLMSNAVAVILIKLRYRNRIHSQVFLMLLVGGYVSSPFLLFLFPSLISSFVGYCLLIACWPAPISLPSAHY